MTHRKAALFWLLVVPALWWLTHALAYLVHEYAHSFSAWALGYKADPFGLNYGHLTPGNVAFLLDIDENVEYGRMFAAGKGYLASLVAVAGVLFGNGLLYFAARRLYPVAKQRYRDVLALFALLLCLMNVGNFFAMCRSGPLQRTQTWPSSKRDCTRRRGGSLQCLAFPLPSPSATSSPSCCPMPAVFCSPVSGIHKLLYWL